MNFKKSRTTMWVGFGIGILAMLIGTGFENDNITLLFMAGGTAIFVATLVQGFIFYRCPHCGYSLMNVRGAIPEYCPKCGKELKSQGEE